VSFPLLADFHPRGEVADKFGAYLADKGITDRATVIIDRDGIVRHASSVGPGGRRDIDELLATATQLARAHGGAPVAAPARPSLAADATLYVKDGCRFCESVLRAVKNLRCEARLTVRNVSREPAAREELDRLAGAGAKVPALVQDGTVQHESADIIKTLASCFARR
jgi:glutaredoxin